MKKFFSALKTFCIEQKKGCTLIAAFLSLLCCVLPAHANFTYEKNPFYTIRYIFLSKSILFDLKYLGQDGASVFALIGTLLILVACIVFLYCFIKNKYNLIYIAAYIVILSFIFFSVDLIVLAVNFNYVNNDGGTTSQTYIPDIAYYILAFLTIVSIVIIVEQIKSKKQKNIDG